MATLSSTAVLFMVVLALPSVQCRNKAINFGVILPHSTFRERSYVKTIKTDIDNLKRYNFSFSHEYTINSTLKMLNISPSPTDILNTLCQDFLEINVISILYLSDADVFGARTASTQYFLQLAGYLGIPVLCWTADNSGMEQMSKNINLQLAPSLRHQGAAMLSILRRYNWLKFGIVTSQIAGHMDFIQAVRDLVDEIEVKFSISQTIVIDNENPEEMVAKMMELANSETRILLLYSTREEATYIFTLAEELKLTGKDYVWIVTHSVIGGGGDKAAPPSFPIGMLGVHFDSSKSQLMTELGTAIKVFAHGLELLVTNLRNANISLHMNLTCIGQGEARWHLGETFYKHLRNISINLAGSTHPLEFNYDGTLKYVELDIMNLNLKSKWEKIGKWTNEHLEINDIVWPGNAHVPPLGKPDKYHLKVVFLEEPAFVNLAPPDPVTNKCINQGVRCRISREFESPESNLSAVVAVPQNASVYQCCSGFSIDLLEKFAKDLEFEYEMFRVDDGYWGTEVNGKWNGLVAALLNHKADIVMTAFKINSYRESVIDFSVPFMETGIAIVVAKRTGIISPKAFLEPFDTMSWLFILLVGTQVAAFFIFFFEWLSPSGYGMKTQLPRDHRFSLFRTYWLVWAILFGAAVNVDCPRGYTARYLSNVWAMVAVVFLAIYTANLAAFMITREEFYNLSGIGDPRLSNPFSVKPPFRYGTIPYANTEAVLQKNLQHIYRHMKPYNRSTVMEGLRSVKQGQLDAFIYDATVLQYLVAQDDDCRLLTVGNWYAMTGYGIGFPKNFKHTTQFNKQMLVYRENGDLERLRRFWLTGGCHPRKKDRTSSNPLSVNQFMSAFLLLASGIFLAGLLLFLEHVYFKYIRKPLSKTSNSGCCALISLSMGRSLTFREAVYEAQHMMKEHKCKDPLCDMQLWKVKYQLDLARMRIYQLENQLDTKERHLYQGTELHFDDESGFTKAILAPRDMTRNHISTTEPPTLSRLRGVSNKLSAGAEVAELETVL